MFADASAFADDHPQAVGGGELKKIIQRSARARGPAERQSRLNRSPRLVGQRNMYHLPNASRDGVIQRGQQQSSGGGSKRRESGSSKDDSLEGPSESEKQQHIARAYDRLQDLALRLTREQNRHLRFWKDGAIRKERNEMVPAMKLAVLHDDANGVLTELVMFGMVEGGLEGARQAILQECSRRLGGGAAFVPPLGRLIPDIQPPTEAERQEAERHRLVEGNDPQKKAMRIRQLDLKAVASEALDHLQSTAKASNVPSPGAQNLDQVIASTLNYYQGPTEEGHEIWVLVQAFVRSLCEGARDASYPIWDPEVQRAIAQAATRLAEHSSTGSWSADREDQGATTKR